MYLLQNFQEQQRANSLMFIDPTVEDYQSLIADALPSTEVIVLNLELDGVEQITNSLAKYQEISSLHIVSHGATGSLQLSSTNLNSDNLSDYSEYLQQWANALTDDADILLYGCDVAKGEVGEAFVQRLSEITGASVAASNNLTGNAELGGDWDLEVQIGAIKAPQLFNSTSYEHILATYTVRNTNDSGANSLRQAITNANNNTGADTINFSIPGSGVQTINLLSDLPSITDTVNINGYSQSGASENTLAVGNNANLLIVLNGSGTNSNGTSTSANGLRLAGTSSSGSTIQGLVIQGFKSINGNGNGIAINNSSNNTIRGNFIGTNAAGSAAVGNQNFGINQLNGASNNIIGGSNPGDRNVISGNTLNGIVIGSTASTGHQIKGNYIGTNAAGTASLANGSSGVTLNSANNIVGGSTAGDRNVISGNTQSGIVISGSTATGNQIKGNYIGTNAVGDTSLANGSSGVFLNSASNFVGGSTAGEGNVISGNTQSGITATANSNQIKGNYIGTNAAGNASLANGSSGVSLTSAENIVGGSTTGERNVISGNTLNGIFINGSTAIRNDIKGNYIGTNAAGDTSLANGSSGVSLNSANNFVGGSTAGEGNVISGNTQNGIVISGSTATGNQIQGNYIGTNAAGTARLGNTLSGVRLESASNIIGGSTAGARNVISGNNQDGIITTANNNQIKGNYIGTNAAGTDKLGNTLSGIYLNSTNNIIGGSTAGDRNVISGNNQDGITTAGNNNQIKGNYIGTNADGTAELGNTVSGILLGSADNIVGGSIAGEGNVISGNEYGIYTNASNATGNIVKGNYIGTNAAGTDKLGNTVSGVFLTSANNIIGGSTAGDRNVISGNNQDGIVATGNNATNNQIKGNYIGTNAAGTDELGNTLSGVFLSSANNIVGGSTAGDRNIISANGSSGVVLGNSSATGNRVQGNYIGTDVTGTANLGNGIFGGVEIFWGASNNTIGGTNSGEGNLITFNRGSGIAIYEDTSQPNNIGNSFLGNQIFSNSQLGIDIDGDNAINPNDLGDVDTGNNNLQNFPLLSSVSGNTVNGFLNSNPNTNFRIEFFANTAYDPSGAGEGEVYLGFQQVTTDANGNATVTYNYTPVTGKPFLTATATNLTTGDTSEFSLKNQAPVNTAPATANTNQNTPIIFSTSNSNAITVADPNAGNSNIQVTLTATNGTLTLGSNVNVSSITLTDTVANINSSLNGLRFNPTTDYIGAASIQITSDDLAGNQLGGSLQDTDNINISVINNPPVVTLPGAAISYTENAAPTVIDSGATVTDDSSNFNTGTLTVRFTNGATPEDRLAIRNQGNGAGQIGLDGRIINYGGTEIGTFTGGIGSENLVVTFNNAATPTAAQALLQNITFSNVSETPTISRTVEVVFTDSSGSTSNTVTKNITLTPVNDAPVIGRNIVLYNGASDTLPTTTSFTPDAKGWIYSSNSGAVVTNTGGVTNLNTTADAGVQAGFANTTQTLNNTTGYTVSFNAQVLAESRTSTANKNNDGKDDRAGFSILVVSNDNTKAIELGFWEDRIWAQDDGTTQINPALEPDDSPQSNFRTLFTQAESVVLDTKTNPLNYDLTVQGNNYTLFANGNTILSGTMRNYTAFNKLPAAINPYIRSNNIFFGDNTPSAQASVNLAKVAVTTNTTLPTLTATEGTPLGISSFSITDLDVGASNLTLNLSVGKGFLTVSNVTSGVPSGNITNNGTANVTLTGTLSQINTTLAANGLTYQIDPNVFGIDNLNISVSDGITTTQKTEPINIVRIFNGAGNNDLTGTPGDDLITGGPGAKILTGGDGNDQFIFNSLRDIGQTIADFAIGSDKIVLTGLLNGIVPNGYNRNNTLTDGYVKFVQGSNNTILQIDRDGNGTSLIARDFLTLDNITSTEINNINNFVF
jgi:hypothetical protein